MDHTTAPDCCWLGCREPQTSDDLKLCGPHAFHTYIRFRNLLESSMEEPEPEAPQFKADIVYYLMIGPTTVKIGTTRYLPKRIKSLRSEIQYVIAIEPGNYAVETARHRQFAEERTGRREDFRVSDRLRDHIAHLRDHTYSDELLEMYRDMTTPEYEQRQRTNRQRAALDIAKAEQATRDRARR